MSDMKNTNLAITIDDGSRYVPILNEMGEEIGAFTFHPTDLGIIERYNCLVDDFDHITEPLESIQLDSGLFPGDPAPGRHYGGGLQGGLHRRGQPLCPGGSGRCGGDGPGGGVPGRDPGTGRD